MYKKIGVIQGRLINPPKKNLLQYFPPNWSEEIDIAKKNKFGFIEFFKDRKINYACPFYYDYGFKTVSQYLKYKNFKCYSFCDDYFIKNNLLKKNYIKYFKNLSKNLKLMSIKVYILPLFEKSNLNKMNYEKFITKIRFISKIFQKKKIKVALETNLEAKFLDIFFKQVNHKNLFMVYDSGNRLKKNINIEKEILFLKKKIVHVHLKDKNFKGENVIVGTGNVNFKMLFKALKKINYKKNFAFETNRGHEAISTMKRNLKVIFKIAKEQDYVF